MKLMRKRTNPFNFTGINMNLWVLLDQTRDLVAKARDIELQRYKLKRAQVSTLHKLLYEDRGLTIDEITNWNMRAPNSTLNLVNGMEKIGLVKKTRLPQKNKIIINITDKGRNLYTELTHESIDMILSTLSNREKQQLKHSLIKVRSKSRELLGMDFKPPFLP